MSAHQRGSPQAQAHSREAHPRPHTGEVDPRLVSAAQGSPCTVGPAQHSPACSTKTAPQCVAACAPWVPGCGLWGLLPGS
eukprot:scaffold212157_cov18-Tisochrysis_lutea.AAC.2